MNEHASTRTTEEVPLETALGLLALRVLLDHDGAASLADLATLVAAREADADVTQVPPDTVERARVRLHHQHLPKLADVGLIAYDDDNRIVVPVDLDAIESVLESVEARAR